jgi:iron complex transport system permease protein
VATRTAAEPARAPASTRQQAAQRLARPARLRYATVTVALVIALVVVGCFAVTVGPAGVSLADVVSSVSHHLGVPGVASPPLLTDSIVWQLRMPRVLTAAAVGAGLAISGSVMQSITRNPLADPYLLGVSSGASLGAVAVLVLGISFALPPAAFVGAFLALIATLSIARTGGSLSTGRAVLAGLAIAQLCAAGTSFVIFWSAKGDSYRDILNWLLGSLAGSTWDTTLISVAALIIVGGLIIVLAPRLDAFAFGDTAASALGINVTATRWLFLGAVAVLTGAMVSVSGAIGFVGLILPHIVRGFSGPSHRRLLPAAALAGATFLVIADTAARTVFDPRELPVGIITAFIGVPVFIVLIKRRRIA